MAWDICLLVRLDCWNHFTPNSLSETEDHTKDMDPNLITVTLAHKLYDYDKRDTLMMHDKTRQDNNSTESR